MLTTFIQNLKIRRDLVGKTQEALAEDAGISKNTVTLVELGERNPSLNTITALARGLGCNPWELLNDGTAPSVPVTNELKFSSAIDVLKAYKEATPERQAFALAFLKDDPNLSAHLPPAVAHVLEKLLKPL